MRASDKSQWTNLVEILTRLPERLRTWFDSIPEDLLKALEQPDVDDKQDAHRDAQRIVHDQARIAIIVMADHLESLHRLINKETLMVFSPWVLARAILEEASIVLWLLDGTITCKERWARSLNTRLEGLKVQKRIASSDTSFENPHQIENRIADLSVLAGRLGISRRGDKRNPNRFGNAGHPRILDKINKTLREETAYRILSAMTHGDNWALISMGFARDAEGRYGPDLDYTGAVYLISKTIEWFASVHWQYGHHYGFDLKELSTILEEEYDKAGLSEAVRFWRVHS